MWILVYLLMFLSLPSYAGFASGSTYPPLSQLQAATGTTKDITQLIVKLRPGMRMLVADDKAAATSAVINTTGLQATYGRSMSGNAHVLKLPQAISNTEAWAYAKKVATSPEVEYALPDLQVYPLVENIPNDPFYTQYQWHYASPSSYAGAANLPLAWGETTGLPSITVAVVDTGLLNHADLKDRLVGGSASASGYDFISNSSVAKDGDGRDANPSDPGDSATGQSSWHGTHVAGTIGAKTNNGLGVAGVDWNAKLLGVRVLGAGPNGGTGSFSDLIDGIRWAAGIDIPGVPTNTNPARVINMSLGGSGTSCANYPAMQEAIDSVVAKGTIVVVAAGNEAQDATNVIPASCNNVVTVAATDMNGALASFSNFGSKVDLTAPGVNIASTVNAGTTAPAADAYAYYNGTSMATPHVTGVVSLMLAANAKLRDGSIPVATVPALIEAKLKAAARVFPTGTTSDCNTSRCGAGLLDAYRAVKAVSTPPVANAGNDQTATGGSVVTLSGIASKDDSYGGTIKQYVWVQTGGSIVTLSGVNTSTASFIVPAEAGTLSFRLTVTDDTGLSSTDDVTVTVTVSDSKPDAFSFTDQTDVALASTVTSNEITVSGINTAAAISITGGEYRVNGGAYTSAAGTVNNGDKVQVRHVSSASYATKTDSVLTIGGVADTFTSTTLAEPTDTTPDAFSFTDQTDVALSTTVTSNEITVSGINTAAEISITGGEYRVNGGAYTSAAGTVNNGDKVEVRHVSSASYATKTDSVLTIGGVSDTFTSITVAEPTDTTPDAFSFTDQTDVALASTVTSDEITVSGINAAAEISITSGEYSVNGGEYTGTAGTVNNGDKVEVRHVSSASYATKTHTVLTIGGVADTFTSTTLAEPTDTTPDAFSFKDQVDVALASTVTSNEITVSGITAAAEISITGGEYRVNGGAYTSAAGTVNNGDKVQVQHTSSASYATQTDSVLTIGGVADTFTSTTLAEPTDTTPDAFSFKDQTDVALASTVTSNEITVSGITAAAEISVTGGEYRVNGGAYTSAAGTVNNGDKVEVQHVSSASYATKTDSVLTIGSVADTFTSITLAEPTDTTPDAFSFKDQTDVALSTTVTSNEITVSGINAATVISVKGGEYSINAGAYTSEEGVVRNDDKVTVRHTSSADYLTETTTTLTIGGVADTFTSTTLAKTNTPPTVKAITATTDEDMAVDITLVGADADGDTLAYLATQPANGMVAVLGNKATYTPKANWSGTDEFSYTVSDGKATSDPATVKVTVNAVNDLPTANAGNDQTVNAGANVLLAGSGSDIDGDNLTYAWVQTSGTPTVTMTGANTATPSFTAPQVNQATKLVFTLTVSDGKGGTASDSVEITIKDITPDAFTFTDQTGVALSSTVTSNEITVAGINAPSAISVTGGKYSINGGAYVTVAGTVNNGDKVKVQQTSSASYATKTDSVLTIGGVSDTFTSTTVANTTPIVVKAVPGNAKLTLSWDTVTEAAGYSVCRATENIVDINKCATYAGGVLTTATTPTAVLTGLVNGTTYHIRIAAKDSNGTLSRASVDITATPLALADGLVAYYPFNGNANDESGNRLHGTVYGATLAADQRGKPNSAYYLDGVSNYIYFGKQIPDMTSMSMALWLKSERDDSSASGWSDGSTVVSDGDSAGGNDVMLQVENSRVLVRADKQGKSLFTWGNTGVSMKSVWRHVVWVMTATDSKIYVDGVLKATINSGGSNVGYHDFMIGTMRFPGPGWTGYWKGTISDLRVYNRVISAAEVTQIYQEEKPAIVQDTTPDAFSFTDQTGVALSAVVTSNEITVAGINAPTAISISNGKYSLNGGAYVATAGTVNNGDKVKVQHTASASLATKVDTVLTIGGVSDTFSSTTVAKDTTPDAFTFTDQTGVALSSTVTSNEITVAGINAPSAISVTGGSYSINGGTYTTVAGTVNNGDKVKVQQTASASFATKVDTALTIGGVVDTFSSTTVAKDTTPDAFTFTDQTGVALSAVVTSNEITVAGINAPTTISVMGGKYSINGGTYTTVAGTVNNGDKVKVQQTASASFATKVDTVLTIGGVPDTFSSTTVAKDTTPDVFTFTDQTGVALSSTVTSNEITVSGINAPSAISISNGKYSINGGAYVTTAGTVNNGDKVKVQQTASASFATKVDTALTIGGISDTFSSTTLVKDTTPDAFTFIDQTGVALSAVVTSNEITVVGINAPTTISVTGGKYSINGGTYTTVAGTVNNGDKVKVQQTASASFATKVDTALTIGGVSDTFSSTTVAKDTTPDAFTFIDQTGVALSSTVTSNEITVAGINAPSAISVTGGSYSINGGTYTTVAGTVNNGDKVKVQQTASASFATKVDTALTIGGVSDTFSSTTVAKDTTPDAFTFTDQTGVALSSTVTSNEITVAGINAPTAISISNGKYSLNGGTYTTVAGTVNNGDKVKVQQTASASFATKVDTVLTIGGVVDTFSSTTVAKDTTPDAFTFIDQTGVALSAVVTSNEITVAGINAPTAISISNGKYSLNGGTYTTVAGTVNNGDKVKVQQTASASFATKVDTVLTIGGVVDTFSSTTVAKDTTPDAFTFIDQTGVALSAVVTSNEITISGINAPSAISISNGKYSINGGAYVTTAGTVNNGDKVKVQHTASASFATKVDTVLTIGGVVDTFSSTTIAKDTTPDAFTFIDQTGVALSAVVTSNEITVSGINAPSAISISNGKYSINGGTYTTVAGTVNNGDKVKVQQTASASFATKVDTVLTIGGVSDTFSSTTVAKDTTPDAFTFTDQTGVALSAVVTSNEITVAGINAPTAISISNGKYSINGGAYTTVAGTVNNGDKVKVQQTASSSFATKVDTVLTIGGVVDTFSSTTVAKDTTPDAFSFTDQTGVALSAVVTSNEITVSGINAPSAISISNGKYSINGGTYTTVAGNVNNGDKVKVQHTASASLATKVDTVLTIGGVSDTFSSTTLTGKSNSSVTVDAGSGSSVYYYRNSNYTSPEIHLLSMYEVTNNQVGTAVVNVNGSAKVPVNLVLSSYEAVNWVLKGSGVPFIKSVVVNGYKKSSVSGIDSKYVTDKTGSGNYLYACGYSLPYNGGGCDTNVLVSKVESFFGSPLTSFAGQYRATQFTVTLPDAAVTTPDTTPDAFTFTDQTGVALSSVVTSNEITVAGINAPSAISVTGGKYSLNGGTYTTVAGTVNNGDKVKVQQTASASFATKVDTVLTIGGVSDTFSSTTLTGKSNSSVTVDAGSGSSVYYYRNSNYTSPEIHLLSMYEVTNNQVGTAVVNVNGSAKVPVNLVLSSYEAVNWVLKGSGVPFIKSVVVNGYKKSTVSGIDSKYVTDKTGVGNYLYACGYSWPYNGGGCDTNVLVSKVESFFGSPLTSFAGQYQATQFTVTLPDAAVTTPDSTPDAFTFTDQTDVALSAVVTSNEITVSGINTAAAISVAGGKYSLNGGAYVATAGTVNNGDKVKVQHTASASLATKVDTVLTIGGVSDTFSSTTLTGKRNSTVTVDTVSQGGYVPYYYRNSNYTSPEVHLLSVYEASSDHTQKGTAVVNVKGSATVPVNLVLSSYEGVNWVLQGSGVPFIKSVVINGMKKSSVSGIDSKYVTDKTGSGNYLYHCGYSLPYNGGGCDTNVLISKVESFFGSPLTSFAGQYQAMQFTVTLPDAAATAR